MILKNFLLFNDEFTVAINSLLDYKLTIKTSIEIAKLLTEIENQRNIVFKVRDSIFKRYNTQLGAPIDLPEDKRKEFDEELKILINNEFEISRETKIKLPENVEMYPRTALLLTQIIESE